MSTPEKGRPVYFTIHGGQHSMSVREALGLVARITAEVNKQKHKCPTCRCQILPGEVCPCCADCDTDTSLGEGEP